MAKTSGKDFLIEKGEKVGLGIAVGLGALFLVLGFLGLTGRQDPESFAKEVKGKADGLNSKMSDPNATIPPIKSDATESVTSAAVAA